MNGRPKNSNRWEEGGGEEEAKASDHRRCSRSVMPDSAGGRGLFTAGTDYYSDYFIRS